MREPITFVCVINDLEELRHNLAASPVRSSPAHEWLLIDNTNNRVSDSICALYSDAYDSASNDLVFFFHQDVFLPSEWEESLYASLGDLEQKDPRWGVLGAVGVIDPETNRGHWGDCNSLEPRYIGPLPAEVVTLDELWLGVRRSRGVSFDPEFPGWHCYGIDICLNAVSKGLRPYAIDALVWHKYFDRYGNRIYTRAQSRKLDSRSSPEFQAAYQRSRDHVGRKWQHAWPSHVFGPPELIVKKPDPFA